MQEPDATPEQMKPAPWTRSGIASIVLAVAGFCALLFIVPVTLAALAEATVFPVYPFPVWSGILLVTLAIQLGVGSLFLFGRNWIARILFRGDEKRDLDGSYARRNRALMFWQKAAAVYLTAAAISQLFSCMVRLLRNWPPARDNSIWLFVLYDTLGQLLLLLLAGVFVRRGDIFRRLARIKEGD